jgi:hypothetical protein
MPPETWGATSEPLDLRAQHRQLAAVERERVQGLVVRMLQDGDTFTDWRELMCAVVAAEVATAMARMLPERD